MILDCTSLQQSNHNIDVASIVSITLGLLSIVLSIWFFVLSNKLSNKTTKAIDEINTATKQLNDMHNKYIQVIFEMFKHDHERLADNQFNDSEVGGEDELKEK